MEEPSPRTPPEPDARGTDRRRVSGVHRSGTFVARRSLLPDVLGVLGWIVVLAAVTSGMLVVRERLNEAHVAMVLLLVVLGASAFAGRAVGLTLAGAAFLVFDWFFLPPYGTLIVANPLDWVVLVAFLGTSAVAAQLLYRSRVEADDARARAAEIDHLAVLGAETLNAGRAEDALPAVAEVIRTALGVDWCEVYISDGDVGGVGVAASSPELTPTQRTLLAPARQLVQWVAEHGSEAAVLADGTARVAAEHEELRSTPGVDGRAARDAALGDEGATMLDLFLPLRVRDRVVGVLAIGAADGLRLGAAQQRVLRALSYYAALGVDRVRLVRDAEHTESLRQADRLKDALLASVSHDLRTPLTTIKALANELAADGDERAATIEQEADRLNSFVENLLDLSRIHAGGRAPAGVPNEAEDLVGAALQRVAGPATGRDLRVEIGADPETLLIGRFDFSDTLRALVNLLENALKYSLPASPVDLSVRRDGLWIAFAVADRGPGVAAGDQERIFQPFNRPPGSAPDVGGAGLGLSIARSLATAQGGSVTYGPRPGGGSVFTLRVPALDLKDLRTES